MTDLRAGATHLFLPPLGTLGERKGRFLDAVRKAAAGEFEILGELGRRPEGGIAYLARDLSRPRLVALRFELTPGSQHDYVLDVLKELDPSLPATGFGCPGCGKPLRGWGRYCPSCGFDLSGSSASHPTSSGPDPLRSVKDLVGDSYQVLGQMRRTEGGGMVYFAKEHGGDTIVGLRLRQEEGKKLAMDRTAVIPFLADDSEEIDKVEGALSWDGSLAQSPSDKADDRSGVLHQSGQDESKPIQVARPSRFSWPQAVLIIAATLAIGIVLGVLLR